MVGTGFVGPFGATKGISVSLSNDGNTFIEGGYGDNSDAGAAWFFVRSEGVWSQQGPKLVGTGAITGFVSVEQGFSVALSGDGNTAIVGARTDNCVLSFGCAGAAWVFTRASGVCSQQGPKLVAADAIGGAGLGFSAALSSDGNTAVIGGAFDDNGVGAAWIFTRSGGVWSEQAKLVGTGAVGPYGAEQGVSVSLSGDGNTAIVGGPGDNNSAGATWVFTRAGGVWRQQGLKLVGTGAVVPNPVSLSSDGNIALVGGPQDNLNAGAGWVFVRLHGVWTQQGPKLVGTGINAFGVSEQGFSVSLSGDGSTAIVGGPEDLVTLGPGEYAPGGAAWVFAQPVFAGTPGQANCIGKSVSALANQYGGLAHAAATLGYSSVGDLQNAIATYCEE